MRFQACPHSRRIELIPNTGLYRTANHAGPRRPSIAGGGASKPIPFSQATIRCREEPSSSGYRNSARRRSVPRLRVKTQATKPGLAVRRSSRCAHCIYLFNRRPCLYVIRRIDRLIDSAQAFLSDRKWPEQEVSTVVDGIPTLLYATQIGLSLVDVVWSGKHHEYSDRVIAVDVGVAAPE